MTRTRVIFLGSTGSIGTQGLDVISTNAERFEVGALAGGSNVALLAEQAVAHRAPLVAAAPGRRTGTPSRSSRATRSRLPSPLRS